MQTRDWHKADQTSPHRHVGRYFGTGDRRASSNVAPTDDLSGGEETEEERGQFDTH